MYVGRSRRLIRSFTVQQTRRYEYQTPQSTKLAIQNQHSTHTHHQIYERRRRAQSVGNFDATPSPSKTFRMNGQTHLKRRVRRLLNTCSCFHPCIRLYIIHINYTHTIYGYDGGWATRSSLRQFVGLHIYAECRTYQDERGVKGFVLRSVLRLRS